MSQPLALSLFFAILLIIMFGIFKRKKKRRRTKASAFNPVTIYALKDGRHIFYVGRTNNPSSRLQSHIQSAYSSSTPKARYIADMLRRGKRPTIHKLKVCRSEQDARKWERKLVQRYGKTNVLLR